MRFVATLGLLRLPQWPRRRTVPRARISYYVFHAFGVVTRSVAMRVAAKFRWLSRQTNPTPTESRKSKRDGALDPWRRFELELLRLPRVPFVEPRPEGARRD